MVKRDSELCRLKNLKLYLKAGKVNTVSKEFIFYSVSSNKIPKDRVLSEKKKQLSHNGA